MQEELDSEGFGDAVQFVVINGSSSSSSVTNLSDKFFHPIFQDTSTVNAWSGLGGKKDDIFIYNHGLLMTYLPMGGAVSISLSGAGYANVKNAIMEAIDAP